MISKRHKRIRHHLRAACSRQTHTQRLYARALQRALTARQRRANSLAAAVAAVARDVRQRVRGEPPIPPSVAGALLPCTLRLHALLPPPHTTPAHTPAHTPGSIFFEPRTFDTIHLPHTTCHTWFPPPPPVSFMATPHQLCHTRALCHNLRSACRTAPPLPHEAAALRLFSPLRCWLRHDLHRILRAPPVPHRWDLALFCPMGALTCVIFLSRATRSPTLVTQRGVHAPQRRNAGYRAPQPFVC